MCEPYYPAASDWSSCYHTLGYPVIHINVDFLTIYKLVLQGSLWQHPFAARMARYRASLLQVDQSRWTMVLKLPAVLKEIANCAEAGDQLC